MLATHREHTLDCVGFCRLALIFVSLHSETGPRRAQWVDDARGKVGASKSRGALKANIVISGDHRDTGAPAGTPASD